GGRRQDCRQRGPEFADTDCADTHKPTRLGLLMVDKTPGDRKLSVPNKTLTLKPRVETGTVKQSFSHGRTKQVVVEKRGKRRVGGEAPAAETHAPEPTITKSAPAAPAKAPLARPATPAAPRAGSGVVLRT